MVTVRICVCGDEGTGKSSLITSLVKDTFITNKIQPVLPQITIPPTLGTPENVTTTVIDTSALPQERANLAREIRKSNVILLVYSDHYSYERIALFWMPHLRGLGVNVPVVLCANKSDLATDGTGPQVMEEEMLPLMAEFKEIDSCIRTSAREHYNVNEAFFLCQKAVSHPVAPLYSSADATLKPAAISALRRVFYLCDKNRDGFLNDKELDEFQIQCFGKPLSDQDRKNIKDTLERVSSEAVTDEGISVGGFLLLNKLYAQKGRHETIWVILRHFHYTDNLSLEESFVHPKFEVPAFASTELSPSGYRFLVDLFLLSDKDNDGGLSSTELASAFAPTPGIPQLWISTNFPACTLTNDAGYVTLQGWLAQWSFFVRESPASAIEYLAYLGYSNTSPPNTVSALKVTKPLKRSKRPSNQPVVRTVLHSLIIGAPGSGKTSLLNAFLSKEFSPLHHPTIHSATAINTVELPGGRQIYLILTEPGQVSASAVLENLDKVLQTVDSILYVYDSSDPDSFSYIPAIREKYAHLACLPSVYVALKADLDRTPTQRSDVQPDEYVREILRMPQGGMMHASVRWGSVSEVWTKVAEAGIEPWKAWPKVKGDNEDSDGDSERWEDKLMRWGLVGAAVVGVGAAAIVIWRRAKGI
ncbi:putative mitochondrial gtpase (miro-2) [Phaeomoniella chlamydospora]|uniref:Mitochondrial Rho GTPase n=1 Tax=Phaeomoniella chlamydospora TaxID=158046 RepID=A0A0G2E596_PHACM|nr:putative mitochondrial gtpase (miro-2) [Phaeomoniella chlamydospora]